MVAVRHGSPAEVVDLALVDRVAGVGVEHTVAGVHQRLDELGDDRLAAGLDHDVLRTELDAATRADVGGQCLAKRRDAGGGAVPGLAVGDRGVHRLDDVGRRGQVHVAEVERVDPIALLRPRGGGARDGERGFGSELVETVGQVHARSSSFVP